MRVVVIVLGVLLLMTSCQFIDREKLLDDRLNTLRDEINFNDVEHYPNFRDGDPNFVRCNPLAEKSERLACFQHNFSAGLQSLMQGFNYVTDKDIDESAKLIITIDNNGFIALLDYRASDDLVRKLPKVEKDLRELFESISVIPATKFGEQVSVRCSMQIDFETK